MKTGSSTINPKDIVWDNEPVQINPDDIVWDSEPKQAKSNKQPIKITPLKTFTQGGLKSLNQFNLGLTQMLEAPVNLGISLINKLNPNANITPFTPLSGYYRSQLEKGIKYLQEAEKNKVNKVASNIGQFVGAAVSDIPMILTGGAAAEATIARYLPEFSKLAPATQAAIKTIMSSPGYTYSKKAIMEHRLPTAKELAQDAAFFGGSGAAGKAAGQALKNLPKLVKAPLEGAIEGVGGLAAAAPFSENPEQFKEEVLPTAAAMALMNTAGALGKQGKAPVKTVEKKPVEVKTEIKPGKVLNTIETKTVEKSGQIESPKETVSVSSGEKPITFDEFIQQEDPYYYMADRPYEVELKLKKTYERLVAQKDPRVFPAQKKPGKTQPNQIKTTSILPPQTEDVKKTKTKKAVVFNQDELNNLGAKLERGEQLTPEEEARFIMLNHLAEQIDYKEQNRLQNYLVNDKNKIKQEILQQKVEQEQKFNKEIVNNPDKLFEAKGGLNGKALFVDGKIIYPKDIINRAEKYFEEDRKNRPDQVNDRGHDALYSGLMLLKGNLNDINSSFSNNPGVHIIKDGNTFNLRYDIDNFLKDSGKVSEKQAFNKIFDTVKALKKDGHSGKLSIPELGYEGTINDFLGEPEQVKLNKVSQIQSKGAVQDGVSQGKGQEAEVIISKAVSSIKSWPTMNKAGFTAPEEVYMAFEAKSKGKDWFKKEFSSLPDSDQVYNQLIQKVDSLSPKDRSKFKFDIQYFAKQNPSFTKAAKERLLNLYGAIPRGEAPRLRNVDVPAATDEGKTRRFARTAYEILPKEAARQTMEDVMAGKFAYEPLSNKESIRKAEAEINANADEAYQKWQGIINSGKRITADDIALGEALLTKAARDKDLAKVSQLTIDLASEFTNAGQTVQYAQLLKKMSPEGYGVYVERQIKRVNREYKQKYGDKFKGFKLSESDRKAILEAPTMEEREKVAMDIAKRMAQEAPVSFMEKFNAWRRIAMLLNPLTHVRNIVSNAIVMPVRKVTDAIGASLEKVMKVPEGKRTKAVGWAKDSSLVKLVDESWEANKKKLTSSGRWDISQILGQEKRIFKTKPIESLNRFSKSTMEAEDVPFLRKAYQDALGQYLKANKMNTVTDAAVNYAVRRANEATYRDLTALINLLNKVKREGGGFGVAVEALMPFTKTPINIARRGIEHSPIGLIRGLANYFGKVKQGKMEATEAIEQLAKGLTGTGAMTLGIILAKLGIITGAEDDDLDKAAFDKAVGKQPFAVNIGGHYYTWDWVQPVSLPVAMGAQVYQSIKNNEGLVNSIMNATAAGADVLLNLPLFQGVKRTLKGFALSPDYGAQSAANAMFDIFDSYVRQAVPVLGGQIARTLDRTIRTTYTPKGEKGILSTFGTRAQSFGKYFQSRIPGLSQQLPAKISTLGEPVQQPKNWAVRAFLNFVSPGFYSKYQDSPAVRLVETVYRQTGDKSIFPRVAPKTITVDNKKYILTAQEYSRFQQYIGQEVKKNYDRLANDGSFLAKTNEEKIKIMKKELDKAFDNAKQLLIQEKGIQVQTKPKKYQLLGF